MNNPAVRGLVAVVVGVLVAGIVVAVVQFIGHAAFPPPAGLDVSRPDNQGRIMEAIPFEAKLAVVIAWFLGALAGATMAIAVARRTLPAWIVGLCFAGLGLWTTQMFPHPDWMLASAVVLPLVAVLVAKRLMRGPLATA